MRIESSACHVCLRSCSCDNALATPRGPSDIQGSQHGELALKCALTQMVGGQGNQMIPVLNKLGIQAATIGNHEFDFGLDMLEELIDKTNFPWLLSNIRDRDTGALLRSFPACVAQFHSLSRQM